MTLAISSGHGKTPTFERKPRYGPMPVSVVDVRPTRQEGRLHDKISSIMVAKLRPGR